VVHSAAAGEAEVSQLTQEGTTKMTGTQVREATPARTTVAPASAVAASAATARSRGRRGHELGRRLWSLLHAQALLNGTAAGPGDLGFAEDDRRRLAARRER
jgi:hypothetical protein